MYSNANINTISGFNYLNLSQKFIFFEEDFNYTLSNINEKELNKFLRQIILNSTENANIRKKALEAFINCVMLNKLKVRHALSLLIDDWVLETELFLELHRLKELFLFYSEEPNEIVKIYSNHLSTTETEILSESYHNLGLINFQKGLLSDTQEELVNHLQESKLLFINSSEVSENRIDSYIYRKVVSIIIDILNGLWIDVDNNLKSLASLLFLKETYSFQFSENSFYVSLYRALNSLNKIKKEKPEEWLNFRNCLKELYYQYSLFQNQELKGRLNRSVLSSAFTSMLEKQFIEPYFALNFNAELSRIDVRLNELEKNTEEYNFLIYIRDFASNPNKKKVHSESLNQKLKNNFPNRNSVYLENMMKKIQNINDPIELLNAYFEISKKSLNQFIDKFVHACLLLQKNRVFRGHCLEDDRNTYIADILEAGGYPNKDQTRWSNSNVGKSAGEIDIFIRENDGKPYAIIEAFILNSLKKNYIILHLDKIFKYDTSGLENNFILVYSEAKDFIMLWKKYIDFISNHSYKFEFVKFDEIDSYKFADLKIGKAKHFRNKKNVYLYHIMIDLYSK